MERKKAKRRQLQDSNAKANRQDDEKHRFEDVFQEVIEKFSSLSEFKKFARSGAGLKLKEHDLNMICENKKGDAEGVQLAMLWLWKQNNNTKGGATPDGILEIADGFLHPEDENVGDSCTGYPHTERGDVGEKGNGVDERPDPPPVRVEPLPSSSPVRKRGVAPRQETARVRERGESLTEDLNIQHVNILGHPDAPRLILMAFLCGAMAYWLLSGGRNIQHPGVWSIPAEAICHDSEASFNSFMWKVNNSTYNIASAQSVAELKKPDFQEFPETVVVNFYNTPAKKHGYVPELGFSQQVPRMGGQLINMADFFKDSDSHVTRYVALVGGVGYGKTEMLKHISLDVLEGLNPPLAEIKIVHFVNLRDLVPEKEITPRQLLFGGIGLTDNEINCGIEFIKENPKKVLFILDGIDQYTEKLDKCASFTSEKGNTSRILSALLCGRLFPDVQNLISSREHAIRHFEGDMRPDKVIALAGFTLQSVEKLVRTFGGTDGERIWNHLSTRSPTLLSVSSIPMFLVFSVLVLKDTKLNPPETLTEVLMHLLHYHISSEHVHENILEVISKLKPMSFRGTKNGEVTFTLSDLPEGVSIEGAKDLMIPLTGIKARNQRLFDGHFQIHFCHQSLQEALTALHVAEMPLKKFQEFVDNEIHLPKWVIVRRLVYGLLLNNRTSAIARGLDPTVGLLNMTFLNEDKLRQKRGILKQSLKKQLIELQGDGRLRQDLLELLHAFHECEESVGEIVQSAMHEINFLNIPLTQSDFHVLLSTLNHCPKLMLLSVINCKLTMDQLKALTTTFKNPHCDFKVRILLLGNYEKNLPRDGARTIRDMIPFITDLFWVAYRVEPHDIDMFQKTINGHTNDGMTVVCWRRDTRRLMMLKFQEDAV